MKSVIVGLACLGALAPMGRGQAVSTEELLPLPRVFSPAKNPYAKRLVDGSFQVVQELDSIDPEVRALFYSKVPRRDIASRGERFNATDTVTGRGMPTHRLVFAGNAPGIWFVLYEHGGRDRYYCLVVFIREGEKPWQIAATPAGFLKPYANLGDLKTALNQGAFEEEPGDFYY